MIRKFFNDKDGQLHFFVLLIMLLAFSFVIVAAENSSKETIEEVVNLCQAISCQDTEIECPDGSISACSNSCNQNTGECISCNPVCVLREVQPSEPVVEETVKTILTVNETVSETTENETNNVSKNGTEIMVIQPPELIGNETVETTIPFVNDTFSEFSSSSSVDLRIQISHLSKATRGENFELGVVVVNIGSEAKNVLAEWILPEDFEIIYGNEIENCGDIGIEEICTFTITAKALQSSTLGDSEIKILVSYNE